MMRALVREAESLNVVLPKPAMQCVDAPHEGREDHEAESIERHCINVYRMPDLSIVIPSYNTAAMTLRCCQAVLASRPDSSEVIVVDDGSSDGTADLLSREVPAVRIARLESNRGFAAAANRGVGEAKGRIVLLLNSDAFVEAGALNALLSAFDDDARLGVAGARLLNEDGTPQWSGGRTPTLLWMIGVVSGAGHLARFFRRHSLDRDVDWVSGAAMAFRREAWSPFSERFRFYCQDIEFCLSAKRKGWNVRIVDDARVIHRLGATINEQSPDRERLWRDLLTWGRSHYGTLWWFVARAMLVTIAAIRRTGGDRARSRSVRSVS